MTRHNGSTASPTRRTVTKGAAWAIPMMTVAGAAPAYAASQYYFLNGWINVSRSCDSNIFAPDDNVFRIIGTPQVFTGGGDSDRGLWVFAPPGTAAPTMPYVILYVGNSVNEMTWSDVAPSDWTTPTLTNERPKIGYRAYKTTYNGTWTYNATHHAWVADSAPNVRGTATSSSCSPVSMASFRSVYINNQVYSFERTISI